MTLEDFSDGVAATRQHFEEGLMSAGFVERDDGWVGDIAHDAGATSVAITLPARFPFKPARVTPIAPDSVPWSWHREVDGALCLVAEDDHENLWWADAPEFLAHARAWFDSSDANWAGDRPDLDLDRYFTLSTKDTRLYIFGDLEPHRNQLVRFGRAPNNSMRLVGAGQRPPKTTAKTTNLYGYVADLGDVDPPPRDWADISARIDPSIDLDRRIREWSVNIVVLRYRRGDHDGAVVLEVWPNQAGGISALRLAAGADTTEAKAARSGPRASELGGRRVAVVGVGAVGSFIVDGLVRSGVNAITVFDGDRVMPGNLVRHLVGPESIGMFKATAVKAHVERRFGAGVLVINANDSDLTAPDEAVELFESHELVINATADFAITAMLQATAKTTNKHVLSAVIQNDGVRYRIDVLPSLDGSDPLPTSSSATAGSASPAYENGCGSPISPTPPASVIETAAATVRHAVGMLLNEPLSPVGETRSLGVVDPPSSN